MARTVSYAQQTHDSPNPLTRFAHRSRYRLSLRLAGNLLPQHGSILDFGAGEGTFLQRLQDERPDAKLYAVEPYMTIVAENVQQLRSLTEAATASLDVIGAFEVLEHLTDKALEEFLREVRRALKPGGKLLVTVPIMHGLALPAKELSRALLHRRWGDTSLLEIALGTFGFSVPRTPTRNSSHKGFDFRELRSSIEGGFAIRDLCFSPFAGLPWWLNSQAILVAE